MTELNEKDRDEIVASIARGERRGESEQAATPEGEELVSRVERLLRADAELTDEDVEEIFRTMPPRSRSLSDEDLRSEVRSVFQAVREHAKAPED